MKKLCKALEEGQVLLYWLRSNWPGQPSFTLAPLSQSWTSRRLQLAGHKPMLVGGATGSSDPSSKMLSVVSKQRHRGLGQVPIQGTTFSFSLTLKMVK